MKVGIIGGGNMGGAIMQGLCVSGAIKESDIYLCDLNEGLLQGAKDKFPALNVSTDNLQAVVNDTDIVIVAIKPWLVKVVLDQISAKIDFKKQIFISIAAGVSIDDLTELVSENCSNPTIFRIIPNTAIAVRQSVNIITSRNATAEQVDTVVNLFKPLGMTTIIEERLMGSATALTSCGIAYAMRYVRAATEGAVELGLYPNQAKEMVLGTLRGAVELLEATGNNPEVEIDKVTTPGGITIKGLNAMEENGFTTAVINGLKASAL